MSLPFLLSIHLLKSLGKEMTITYVECDDVRGHSVSLLHTLGGWNQYDCLAVALSKRFICDSNEMWLLLLSLFASM